MNIFRKMMGGKRDASPDASDLEQDFKDMAQSEDEAARADAESGLVALYPELNKGRRRTRGFADIDFDEYVPELDDYEPGQEGEYTSEDGAEARESAERALEVRLAQVRKRLIEDVEHQQQAEDFADPEPIAAPQAEYEDVDEDDYDDWDDDYEEDDGYDDESEDDYGYEDDAPAADLEPEPEPEAEAPAMVEVPAPAAGRSAVRRAGRVKTRLLGFDHASSASIDPFENAKQSASATTERFPVGWLIILDGPGRGASFTLFNGVAPIGRGEDQSIKLDFGDNSISRSNHAMVAYDSEQKKFFLGHGGKANIVRLNAKPVLSTEELTHNDLIRIGETTLRFIALCGPEFDWFDEEEANSADAAIA